jgi:hypothetical protein
MFSIWEYCQTPNLDANGFHYGTKLTRRRIAADIRNMRSRVDELLPIAEENEGFVTAVQARSLWHQGFRPGASHSAGNLGSREFEIRTPEMQSGADCFQEHKANKLTGSFTGSRPFLQ